MVPLNDNKTEFILVGSNTGSKNFKSSSPFVFSDTYLLRVKYGLRMLNYGLRMLNLRGQLSINEKVCQLCL